MHYSKVHIYQLRLRFLEKWWWLVIVIVIKIETKTKIYLQSYDDARRTVIVRVDLVNGSGCLIKKSKKIAKVSHAEYYQKNRRFCWWYVHCQIKTKKSINSRRNQRIR